MSRMERAPNINGTSLIRYEHLQNVFMNLNSVRNEGKFCDVTIEVDGITFTAHKIVLLANSDYFRAMFAGNFNERDHDKITIKGIESKPFSSLLDYMYGKPYDVVDLEETDKVLQAADMLGLTSICRDCEKVLISIWPNTRKLEMMATIVSKFKMFELLKEINAAIRRNLIKGLFSTDSYRSKQFNEHLTYPSDYDKIDINEIPYELIWNCLKSDQSKRNSSLELGGLPETYGTACTYEVVALEIRLTVLLNYLRVNVSSDTKIIRLAGLQSFPLEKATACLSQVNLQDERVEQIYNEIVDIKEAAADEQLQVCVLTYIKDFREDTTRIHFYVFHFEQWLWNEVEVGTNNTIYDAIVINNLAYIIAENVIEIRNIYTGRVLDELKINFISSETMANCIFKNKLYTVYKDDEKSICKLVIFDFERRDVVQQHDLYFCSVDKMTLFMKNDQLYILNREGTNTLHLMKFNLQTYELQNLWRERKLEFHDIRYTAAVALEELSYLFVTGNLYKIDHLGANYNQTEAYKMGHDNEWDIKSLCYRDCEGDIVLAVFIRQCNIKLVSYNLFSNTTNDICVLPKLQTPFNFDKRIFVQNI